MEFTSERFAPSLEGDIYIDAKDDLLERDDLELFGRPHEIEGETAEQGQSYEAQIEYAAIEVSRERDGYEKRLKLPVGGLSQRRALPAEPDARVGELREQVSDLQARLCEPQARPSELQSWLLEQSEESARAAQDYEARIVQLAGELSQLRAQLSSREAQVADLHARLGEQTASHSEAQMKLVQQQAALTEAHTQLLKKDEIVNWIQTSRSWQIAASLQRLSRTPHRLRAGFNNLSARLHLPELSKFEGQIETPAEGSTCSKYLDVSGWVSSAGSRIVLIEAFVDNFFLGTVRYSSDRPDVAAVVQARAGRIHGYAERLLLQDALAGDRTLTVRAFDQNGHQHMFTRAITVVAAGEPVYGEIAQAAGVAAAVAPGADAGEPAPQAPRRFAKCSELIEPDFCTHMEELASEFQNRTGRAPFILNWNTGLKLAEAFPHLAVVSPCTSDGDRLPYFDRTIDIVVLPSANGEDVAEARRVAASCVVKVEGLRSGRKDQLASAKRRARLSLKVEWVDGEVRESPLVNTSIIIPVFNKVAYTRNCLTQLRDTLPPNFRGEIVVVDDASTDETPSVLAEFAQQDGRVKVLRNEQNRGFIESCNRGAEAAAGDVLVFLNNDTLPQAGWLPPLLKVLQDDPAAGAVGGKLIYPDGTLQEAGGVIFCDASGCNFGKHDAAAGGPLYNYLREVDYCSGALLATRRELFLRLGGFDTRYAPAYYEDTDYCFSLRDKGYRVYYQPESVIVHFEGISSGTDINNGVKRYQEINRAKFREKWEHVLQRHPSPPPRYDFATLHALSVRGWG